MSGLDWLARAEAAWAGDPERHAAPGCLGWIPYPLPDFLALLDAAIACQRGPFLDLGAGIGTKVLAAAGRGLRSYGVEIVAPYAREAGRLGARVALADVRGFPVAGWSIVYLNHPLADGGDQASLEEQVQARMRPGSVLITVNSTRPPRAGWRVLAQLADGDLAAVKA